MTKALSLHARRSRFRFHAAAQDNRPIGAINTTPLIDMMLVLLILFIVAIPMQTRRIPLDLPQPGPARAEHRAPAGAPAQHRRRRADALGRRGG